MMWREGGREWGGVQSERLNSKLLRRADLRSTGPYHASRSPLWRQSVCLNIKMQLTTELNEPAATELNVIRTSMTPGLSIVNYSTWSFRSYGLHRAFSICLEIAAK